MTGRRRAFALAAALLTALFCMPVLAACADGAGGDGAGGDPYEGFWRASDVALADFTLLRVWRDGDAYLARADYGAARRAWVEAGTLRVALDATSSPGPGGDETVGAPLALRARRGGLVLVPPGEGSSPVEVVLEPVTKAEYEQALAELCDDHVRGELMELASALYRWAEDHGGRPPAVVLLAPGTEFARALADAGGSWPTNPFNGEPMRVGERPGDFAYDVAGRAFKLAGHLSDGEVYVAE